MPKDKTKKNKVKKSKQKKPFTIRIPSFDGTKLKWSELTVYFDKKGKVSKTKLKNPDGTLTWTHFGKKGLPSRRIVFGNGWEEDTTFGYDKKGRLISSTKTRIEGRVTTITPRTHDPKTGEVTEGKPRTFLDGLH